MKFWRNPTWIIAAFVAMFASGLPQAAWFCSMSGQVGTSALCAGMTQPCSAESKCCQLVTFAPESELGVASASIVPAQTDFPFVSTLTSTPFQLLETANVEAIEHGDFSFYFSSRHGPPLSSGRAPPVEA